MPDTSQVATTAMVAASIAGMALGWAFAVFRTRAAHAGIRGLLLTAVVLWVPGVLLVEDELLVRLCASNGIEAGSVELGLVHLLVPMFATVAGAIVGTRLPPKRRGAA